MREPIIKGGQGEEAPEPNQTPHAPVHRDEGRPVDQMDEKLRPQTLAEVVGQRSVAERLSIALQASKKRGEPLPHILFDGPPGLGKPRSRPSCTMKLGVGSTSPAAPRWTRRWT